MILLPRLKDILKFGVKQSDSLKIEGIITLMQSENGKIVKDATKVVKNTISDYLFIQLFHEMYDGTGSLHMDDLCSAGTGVKDGIVARYSSDPSLYEQLNTTYNSGGDGSDDTEIEYYGESNAALDADRTYNAIYLLKDFDTDPPTSGQLFAYRSVSYTVLEDRRLHVYYKIRKPA